MTETFYDEPTATEHAAGWIDAAELAALVPVIQGRCPGMFYDPHAADVLAAEDRLVVLCLPLVRSAARGFRHLDRDDAEQDGILALLEYVRSADLSRPGAVSPGVLRSVVKSALFVSAAGPMLGVSGLGRDANARYLRLMREHGPDADLVFRGLRDGTLRDAGLSASHFLAVHAAYSGSFFDPHAREESAAALAMTEDDFSEDFALRDQARWLLDHESVTAMQRTVVQLRYAFSDDDADALREANGFHPGCVMSDREISGVLALGHATVSRHGAKALDAMRAAILAS